MAQLKPHPLSALMPPPTPEEASNLARSISENGLKESIVLYQGMILDGNSRYAACLSSGVQIRTRQYSPEEDGPNPRQFVVDKNLHRRHLTAAQKAAIAVKLLQEIEPEPTIDSIPTEDGPKAPKAPKLTIKEAAQTAGLSERSVNMALEAAKANPETVAKLETGELSLHEVHKTEKDKKEKTAREILIDERGKELSRPLRQAVIAGSALSTATQLKKWLDLELAPEEREKLEPLILEGIPVQTALDFDQIELNTQTVLLFFLLRASLSPDGTYDTVIKNGPGHKRGARYRVRIEYSVESKEPKKEKQ